MPFDGELPIVDWEQWYDTECSHETNGGLRVTSSDSATCRLGPQSVLLSRTTTSSLVIPGTKKMITPSMPKGQNMAAKQSSLTNVPNRDQTQSNMESVTKRSLISS